LVGGVDFAQSQFNRATQALRQPGSAFKPILYAAAFERGYSPVAVFHDEPVRFVWGGTRKDFQRTLTVGAPRVDPAASEAPLPEGDQAYEPRNYDGKYGLPAVRAAGGDEATDRRMTLGRALELSSNVIAVQLLDQLGMAPLVGLASRFNLTVKPEMGLCVALGCSEVTLLNLTSAYGSFANGGLRLQPVFIRSVTNAAGDTLYVRGQPLPEQVIGEWTAFQMRRLLAGVIERGTGARARLGRPAGGKTGTNDGPRDTWFVGFTPELVAGVWIGNDDNRPMPSEAGGRTTARIWADFMRQALPSGPPAEFPEPTIEYASQRICNLTGHIARPGCPDVESFAFPTNEVPPEIFAVDEGEQDQSLIAPTVQTSVPSDKAPAPSLAASVSPKAGGPPSSSAALGPAGANPAIQGAAPAVPASQAKGSASLLPFTQALRDAFSLTPRASAAPKAPSPGSSAAPPANAQPALSLAPGTGKALTPIPRTTPPE
jgi:penicillin-binding protein 1A